MKEILACNLILITIFISNFWHVLSTFHNKSLLYILAHINFFKFPMLMRKLQHFITFYSFLRQSSSKDSLPLKQKLKAGSKKSFLNRVKGQKRCTLKCISNYWSSTWFINFDLRCGSACGWKVSEFSIFWLNLSLMIQIKLNHVMCSNGSNWCLIIAPEEEV